MAERLCDDLKQAKLDVITKLMIVLFMTNFDGDDLGYGEFVGQELVPIISNRYFYAQTLSYEQHCIASRLSSN